MSDFGTFQNKRRKLPVGPQLKPIKVDIIDDLCRNEFAYQLVPTIDIVTSRCVRKMNHNGDCLVQNPNNNEYYWIHGATRDPGTDLVLDREKGLFVPYKEKERE